MAVNIIPSTKDWLEIYHDNIEFAEKHLAEATDPRDRLCWKWYIAINKRQLRELEAQQPKLAYEGTSAIAQMKEHTDIVEVIGRYTNLKGNGSQYYGCCLFHDDQSPSLSVDSEKQLWHCFGCGKGGDVIDFIKLAEDLDTRGAMKVLARRT
jgi:hypothetical protein